MQRYAIIGTGAVGGYYGGMLARAGHEVHFACRSDYAFIRSHGLSLDTMSGNFTLGNVNAHESALTMPACDVALVCLKTTQLTALADYLPRCLSPQGVAVTLQNGLGMEERLAELIGVERVLGAVCFLCANKLGPGHVLQTDRDEIHMGCFAARDMESRLSRAVAELVTAGVTATAVPDLQLARWKKLVWNIPYNGLCALLGKTTSELHAEPACRQLIVDLMSEVARACEAVTGVALSADFQSGLFRMTEEFAHYRPSMLLDVLAERVPELAAIYKIPIERARAAGAPMLRVETLHALLAAKCSQYRAER